MKGAMPERTKGGGVDCSPDLEKGEVTAGEWGQKGS